MSESKPQSNTSESPNRYTPEDYTRKELKVVKERFHKRFVDDREEAAKEHINGPKGKGPCCPECNMKPAGLREVSKVGDWGQLQHYRCLQCDHEFSGKIRDMY